MNEHVPPGPSAAPPPAGWYADPGVPGQLRFWDGRTWTDQVSVPQAAAPAPTPGLPAVHAHQPAPVRGPGCLTIVGVVLLAGVLLVVILFLIGRKVVNGDILNEQTAIATCELNVQARLQAPDTARFSDVQASEGATDEWTVTGAVDSRSAGGTTERNTFVCNVSAGPDGKGIELDRLRFGTPP